MIDSKVFISQKNRDSVSFALTCVFYVILLICFAIIPVSKQKKYTEISVQLSSPVQKQVEKIPENKVEQKIEEKIENKIKKMQTT